MSKKEKKLRLKVGDMFVLLDATFVGYVEVEDEQVCRVLRILDNVTLECEMVFCPDCAFSLFLHVDHHIVRKLNPTSGPVSTRTDVGTKPALEEPTAP